jgi:tetratricopeptide (TPR) repeat protein
VDTGVPISSTLIADGKDARRIHALALGLSLFLIYAWGASRTIYVGDSGELVAAVHTLGIPHPSGYPLYVLLGKLWTVLVPVGSIAFRMSLFSAFCAAAAVACFYLVGRRLRLAAVPALFSSLLLAFSPSFWSQANIQRVYSLNALLLVMALYLALAWYRSRQPRALIAAFFVAALGACNHTYMGVFAIALGVFALITEPGLLRKPRTLIASGAAFLLGLSPYLYLPLRSRTNPRLDWGNPETIRGTLDVILRRDAWERAWLESPADLLTAAGDLLLRIGTELFWLGAVLAVVGIMWARAKKWPLLLLLLAVLGNYLAMALHGSRSDLFIWYRYYIPTFVIFALLAGLGLELVHERISSKLAAAALLLPLTMLVVGYPQFDRSDYRIADDFSRTLLSTLPPGAHLSATDDNILFVLIYLQLVEGVRPDIDLILQGVGEADLPPLRFDPDADPLYFTHHPNWEIPELEIVGTGLAFQVRRRGSGVPEPILPKTELDGETDPSVPKDYLTRNLIGHFHYMQGVTFERLDWSRAEAAFAKARQSAPDNDVLFYNLGLIYRRNGLSDRSLASFERSEAINPRHIASRSRVRAADRIGELEAEVERLSRLEAELAQAEPIRDLEPDSVEFHKAMAASLFSRGEPLAARGHTLRALETRSLATVE